MPQMSLHYAAGRLNMLRRDALDPARLERLLTAASLEEARHALSELGWADADTADWEQLARKRVQEAADTVRELTTDPRVTDCFLLKYDVANLKMLIKARCLGTQAGELSGCGTLPADTLRHAVAAHVYTALPGALRAAMETIEQELLTDTDPLRMDVLLDRAYFTETAARLRGTRCASARAYFSARADMLNAITLLRVRQMGREAGFLMQVLLPGGAVPDGEWQKAFDRPEGIPALLAGYGRQVEQAARDAVQSPARLPALERAMDNALLQLMKGERFQYMNIEYIVSYLLAAEREAAAVRLIMAGKANGFDPDAVRERLRDLYV